MPKLKISHRLLLYSLCIIGAILSIYHVLSACFPPILAYFIYSFAGVMMLISGYYLFFDINYLYQKLMIKIEAISLGYKLKHDFMYRTMVFNNLSFIFNCGYALLNGVYGFLYSSYWYGALSSYYVVLSCLRFYGLHSSYPEKQVYQKCGQLFIVLTIPFLASVYWLVVLDKSQSYPIIGIYIMALYTFYKMIIALYYLFKVYRTHYYRIKALRNICFVESLFSLLSLQSSMFKTFDGDNLSPPLFNGIVGCCIGLIIFTIGIFMVKKAKQILK